MKMPRPNFNRKRVFTIAGVVLVVGAAYLSYNLLVQKNSGDDNSTNLLPATTDQIKAGETVKDRFADPDKDPINSPPPKPIDSPISILDSYLDPITNSVVVKTKLPGSSWNSCTLTLTSPTAKTITKSADTIYQPDYTICAGFSIDRIEFTSKGVWQIKLTATKLDGSSSDATSNITIN